MKLKSNRGFTLIELMVVVAIIGICAAIVVPQLVEHKRTTYLTDLVNMVQQTAAQARTLALQTRRATVIEVAETSVSVTAKSGSKCTDGNSTDTTIAVASFAWNAEPYQGTNSVAQTCFIDSEVLSDSACSRVSLEVGSPLRICYAGDGELFLSADDGATWTRSCLDTATGASGATLYFNRFEGASSGDCVEGALDVTRSVHIPIGSAPYSKVGS